MSNEPPSWQPCRCCGSLPPGAVRADWLPDTHCNACGSRGLVGFGASDDPVEPIGVAQPCESAPLVPSYEFLFCAELALYKRIEYHRKSGKMPPVDMMRAHAEAKLLLDDARRRARASAAPACGGCECGVIHALTGDVPCTCPAGDAALFSLSSDPSRPYTGRELRELDATRRQLAQARR